MAQLTVIENWLSLPDTNKDGLINLIYSSLLIV